MGGENVCNACTNEPCRCYVVLTKPQREELQRLASGPQHTFGKARARVQNRLRDLGFAYFIDMGDQCLISIQGRRWLESAPPPIGTAEGEK